MSKALLAFILILFIAGLSRAQNSSVYTDLSDAKCKTLESNPDEGGSYLGECAGIGGYKLHVVEGDLRQTINVIAPPGKKFELNLWGFFGGFSSVGGKAEWRRKGKVPVALIVRYNVSENPEDSTKITSYLMVSKITPEAVCVTAVIKPGRGQNTEARKMADLASRLPCKTERTAKEGLTGESRTPTPRMS